MFDQYLYNEYKDEQIGDLEGQPGLDPLDFIEDDEEEEKDPKNK